MLRTFAVALLAIAMSVGLAGEGAQALHRGPASDCNLSVGCHTWRSTSAVPEGAMVSWAMACLRTVRRSTRTRAQAYRRGRHCWAAPFFCVSVMPRRFPPPWFVEEQ